MNPEVFKGFNSDELYILESVLSEHTFRQSQAIMKIQEAGNGIAKYINEEQILTTSKLIREQIHYWDVMKTMLAFIELERRSRDNK